MQIIFCAEPFAPGRPDPDYAREVAAAADAGFAVQLLDFEALADGDAGRALRRVSAAPTPTAALYRGWMLRPATYTLLYSALRERNILLLNEPEAYRHCHYLPESYPVIAAHTPHTVAVPVGRDFQPADVLPHLAPFGRRPLILKDFVKSRKHEWASACFIPRADDPAAVVAVVARFLELQGADLNEGLVLREYIELEPLARHSRSGMPLAEEYRLWLLDGRRIACSRYWDEGEYHGTAPPPELFADIAGRVRSRFWTMDVARTAGGEWIVVELGDGQVAGLPETTDAAVFYRDLAAALTAAQLPHTS